MTHTNVRTLFVLVTFLTTTLTSHALAIDFRDTQSHWTKQYTSYLYNTCDIKGYKNEQGEALGLFRPDTPISRAELVTMVFKCNPEATATQESSFSDVQTSDWFFEDVIKARTLGWIDGYNDGTFRPHQNINRAEALKIVLLASMDESDITSSNNDFGDVYGSDWFVEYIGYAADNGIVSGYTNGTFRPGNDITRAEAAKIIASLHAGQSQQFEEPSNGEEEITEQHNEEESTEEPPIITAGSPTIEGCPVFPADNPWNTDISNYAVHANSNNYIANILKGRDTLHPDWGGNGEYGIPYVTVKGDQPKVPVEAYYGDESDLPAEGYPIPEGVPVEGGGDKHVIVIDTDNCTLYETWDSVYSGPGWSVGSAAIFDLMSNALRPEGWTSADAAGLPVFPGLVRYEEAEAGSINHALRFTVSQTQKAYIHPATHFASSSTDPNRPPMGLRLRLKADFDTSGYNGHALVILEALKKYGMILADNGSDWYITGASDQRWNDDDVGQLKSVPGSAFEVVETGGLIY